MDSIVIIVLLLLYIAAMIPICIGEHQKTLDMQKELDKVKKYNKGHKDRTKAEDERHQREMERYNG